MKKIILLIIISIILVTACSSDNNTKDKNFKDIIEESTSKADTYIPNGVTPEEIIDVILNDAEFTCVFEEHYVQDIGYRTKQYRMSEFDYWNGGFLDNVIQLGQYRVVDLDNDGYNEVIADVFTDQAIVFHYDNNKVYGFIFNFRAISSVGINGIIHGSSGAATNHEYRIVFNEDTYTLTTISETDNGNYYIGDKKVTEAEYKEFYNREVKSEEVPYQTDYSLLK